MPSADAPVASVIGLSGLTVGYVAADRQTQTVVAALYDNPADSLTYIALYDGAALSAPILAAASIRGVVPSAATCAFAAAGEPAPTAAPKR